MSVFGGDISSCGFIVLQMYTVKVEERPCHSKSVFLGGGVGSFHLSFLIMRFGDSTLMKQTIHVCHHVVLSSINEIIFEVLIHQYYLDQLYNIRIL